MYSYLHIQIILYVSYFFIFASTSFAYALKSLSLFGTVHVNLPQNLQFASLVHEPCDYTISITYVCIQQVVC